MLREQLKKVSQQLSSTEDVYKRQGSNGMASDPSKVMKGKKMPGQMGHVQITIQNLEVVKIDAENNVILVKGSVPGPKKSLVTLKAAVKEMCIRDRLSSD